MHRRIGIKILLNVCDTNHDATPDARGAKLFGLDQSGDCERDHAD
jgi:hypothetical protein